MSRTKRRGWGWSAAVKEWVLAPPKGQPARHRPDYACNNPACCGGKDRRRQRRIERARAKDRLRRDPEGMSALPDKEGI